MTVSTGMDFAETREKADQWGHLVEKISEGYDRQCPEKQMRIHSQSTTPIGVGLIFWKVCPMPTTAFWPFPPISTHPAGEVSSIHGIAATSYL